jgi:hypothetical protein
MNPKAVEVPAASAPFQETFFTVTVDPLVLRVPLHAWLTDCPLPSVQLTVQPSIAEEPAVTVTSPWKPPDQEPTVR